DRGNPRLTRRFDPLSPPLLGLLRDIRAKADAAGVPVSVCGEMAGRPIEAMALVGIGFRALSMAPGAIGPVKAMIRSLDAGALTRYMAARLECDDQSLRGRLRAYARDHGVPL